MLALLILALHLSYFDSIAYRFAGCEFRTIPLDDHTVLVKWTCP